MAIVDWTKHLPVSMKQGSGLPLNLRFTCAHVLQVVSAPRELLQSGQMPWGYTH